MVESLHNLVAHHQSIKAELILLLETDADPTTESIEKLDHSLDEAFQKIISMELQDGADILERIRFVIGEITEICESGALAKTLTDRLYEDACNLNPDILNSGSDAKYGSS